MVRMNLMLNAQRTMELELPNVDAKNGQIHDTLLTAVASTSLTDTSCCLGGTPWIPSGHHLPHERLGHQSNMQALGPKKYRCHRARMETFDPTTGELAG